MSFHVGSTSALVVKTTQLSLWLKLAWALKRNCFYERKNLQRISAFFSHGNSNEQSLSCIPMSTNWLKNWKKHLLVMGGHGHQRPNSLHTHSNRHKLHRRSRTSALLPFSGWVLQWRQSQNKGDTWLHDILYIALLSEAIPSFDLTRMYFIIPSFLRTWQTMRECAGKSIWISSARTVFRFNLRRLWDHVSENFKVLPMKHPYWMSLQRSQHYCGLCYALMFLPHGVCRTGWKWKPCASLNSPLSLWF